MKKTLAGLFSLIIVCSIFLFGCSDSSQISSSDEVRQEGQSGEDMDYEDVSDIPSSDVEELIVRFGEEGIPFTMKLEDNSTAAAIAGYVGTSDWQLPIYDYEESDVMQYYDIPSHYDIPDNSETVTKAYAGDVFYSDPNRVILYYHEGDISEQYTKIGTFEATQEFIDAVEENPVLEGWGNKLVFISDGE